MTIYEEMEYNDGRFEMPKLIADGDYKSYHYIIVNFGTHPCAYIRLPETSPFYMEYYGAIDTRVRRPHGGFTFSDFLYDRNFNSKTRELNGAEGWYLGWDYAHIGDYSPFVVEGKKWTVAEIENEIKAVIDSVVEVQHETKARTDETQKTSQQDIGK